MLRVPFILEMISAVPFMITVSSRAALVSVQPLGRESEGLLSLVGGSVVTRPLKPLISLTGDFSFLQKPLHPRVSQLLARQALPGKHDCE